MLFAFMSNTLREITDHLLNVQTPPIKSVENYYKAKRGEEVPAPVYVEVVDKLLEYYENLNYETVVTMYLDLCDTLDSARGSELNFATPNLPHIITYNKSMALGIIINKHIDSKKSV